MSRKDRERERQETNEQLRGREAYRGHVLHKWFISLAGVGFWRVDILSLGLDGGTPMAMIQYKADEASLEKTTQEAKKVVGWFIKYGADINAVEVPVDFNARKADPFDALVMKSSTGKRSVCDKHWMAVRMAAFAGECNPLVFNIALTQAFMAKMQEDGILQTKPALAGGYTMNVLLDSYAPICCWLGEEKLIKLMEASKPSVLIERAKQANV